MIVNDIFKSYLSGMSINEIAEHLNTIYPKENSKWNPRTIHAILRNEKYIGDSLYQKTYTTDSLPLKRYLNTGQRSKYYAMETHEGIISKTDYEKVQNLLAKKSITGEIDRTCVFSKKIYCSICGAICSRKGPPTQGFVWCCRTHLQSKALCLLKSIREDELQQAFLSIYNRLQCNQKTILEPLVDDLLGLRHLQEQKYKKRLALAAQLDGILRQMKAGENLKAQLQKQLEKAQQEFDRLLEMSLELDESTPFLDDKLRKLSGKIKILKANIAESTDGKGEDEEATKQLTAQDLLIKEYDDILTARIIEKVIVHSRQEIEIYFIGGYTQKIDLI